MGRMSLSIQLTEEEHKYLSSLSLSWFWMGMSAVAQEKIQASETCADIVEHKERPHILWICKQTMQDHPTH